MFRTRIKIDLKRICLFNIFTMPKNTRSNYLTGAEGMVKLLEGHGVKYIFGLCGDTSLPFYDALYRLNHSINTYIN